MSIEAMAVVLHHSRARGTDKLVLLGIANHAGDGGAWPTVATLSRYANVDPRNVQAAVQRLTDLGELSVERGEGGTNRTPAHQRPNLYHVQVECPPACDRSTAHRMLASPPDESITPPPDASITPPPDAVITTPLMPASPEPSVEPSKEPDLQPPDDDGGMLIDFPLQPASQSQGRETEQTHFDKWWVVWPKKDAKKAARKAYSKAYRNVGPAVLMDALLVQLGKLKQDEARGFCPLPASWLNGERWEDDATEPTSMRSGNLAADEVQRNLDAGRLDPALCEEWLGMKPTAVQS